MHSDLKVFISADCLLFEVFCFWTGHCLQFGAVLSAFFTKLPFLLFTFVFPIGAAQALYLCCNSQDIATRWQRCPQSHTDTHTPVFATRQLFSKHWFQMQGWNGTRSLPSRRVHLGGGQRAVPSGATQHRAAFVPSLLCPSQVGSPCYGK